MSKDKHLVRLCVVGSVDDGKSTLLGRLFYDLKCVPEDQCEAMVKASKKMGRNQPDLSLLMDGLAAEREQGITIDVAYRYFETESRKYIVADTPGHEQYTRNMVTGASLADIAVVLVDARKGVLVQTRRHSFIASLMQVPHLIVAVNKMDLIDYSKERYEEIVRQYQEFSARLKIDDVRFVPLSSLTGENVAADKGRLDWYEGLSFLQILDDIYIASDENLIDFRFPVQRLARAADGSRLLCGTVASGVIRPGEEVLLLPSRKKSRISRIETFDGPLDRASAAEAAALVLEDERDVSRGDMVVRPDNVPCVSNTVSAMICWMDEQPLQFKKQYILKHSAMKVTAWVRRLNYIIDVNTLHRDNGRDVILNDIARIDIETAKPVFFDNYAVNRRTGSFVLIDPVTNATVAAGMIRGETQGGPTSENVTRETALWSRDDLERIAGHKGAVIWLTGLSGSGKSTLAKELQKRLYKMNCRNVLLDGDNLRHGICGNLGFSIEDRKENIRRAGEVAKLFCDNANIAMCALISPFESERQLVRNMVPPDRFFEIYIKCDISECVRRDPKGLYRKAMSGEITGFTGIDSPYEEPTRPDLVIDTGAGISPSDAAARVMNLLYEKGITGSRE